MQSLGFKVRHFLASVTLRAQQSGILWCSYGSPYIRETRRDGRLTTMHLSPFYCNTFVFYVTEVIARDVRFQLTAFSTLILRNPSKYIYISLDNISFTKWVRQLKFYRSFCYLSIILLTGSWGKDRKINGYFHTRVSAFEWQLTRGFSAIRIKNAW